MADGYSPFACLPANCLKNIQINLIFVRYPKTDFVYLHAYNYLYHAHATNTFFAVIYACVPAP